MWPDTLGILSRYESRPTIYSTCMVRDSQPVEQGNLAPTIRYLSANYGYASHKCQQNLKNYNESDETHIYGFFRRSNLAFSKPSAGCGMVDQPPLWVLRTETTQPPAKSGIYGSLIRFVGYHRQATKTENRQGRPISKAGVTVRRSRLSEFSGDFNSHYSMSTLSPGSLIKHCG